ncbi:CHAT domain-containing protein [Acrocarpospora sp. B8E8]|uniref:CHAT domain-containing protein n=1 Tax=Acrocarpospora sp. B8E8 TaxID=3153572 RepID=UPI00325E9E98
MDTTASELAAELLRLAEDDPAELLAVAAEIAEKARADGDFELASVASRAVGIAAMHAADLGLAERHLLGAIRFAALAGAPALGGEARLRLAFVWCVLGRIEQAMAEIDGALPDLDAVGRARAEAQRGVIFNHLKRSDDALGCYRAALPVLRRAGDRLWLQRVLCNRGVAHGYRHEFGAAETDLHKAAAICRELGLSLSLAIVQQNLGWVSALRGEVPTALRQLDLAEERFRDLDTHQLCWTLADRTELLLSAGLIAEARMAGEEAVAQFTARNREIGLPEARLLLARIAYLEGDHAGSAREARDAVTGFQRQGRSEWAVLACFVELRSVLASGAAVTLEAMERCAGELVEAGWPGPEVEARMLAAGLAADCGQHARAQRQLALAGRNRHRGPAILRARAWHAEALLRLARGNRRGAKVAIRTALGVHDDHRATLGATDLRAHASRYRMEVAELGLRLALDGGDPADLLSWAEQGRARHLLRRPMLPPDDSYLAEAMAQLRVTVARIQERAEGQGSERLEQLQIALERKIRDHCRWQDGGAVAPEVVPVSADELAAALGDSALVEYLILDDTVHAITIAAGRVRLWRLGPLAPVGELVNRVPFALRRLGRYRAVPGSRSAAAVMLRDAAAKLDTCLLAPLATEVGDRPLVLIPTGPLQGLPWSVLPSMAGRPVSVSPSAALWHAGTRRAHADGPTVVASGPGLPEASREAAAVASIHGVSALVGGAATTHAVVAALDGARLAHLAAHGRLHATNPLFSSLRLADGPLTLYDLERLGRPPQMIVLAACDTGRPVVTAGDELLGFGGTFLALGTRTIVASVLSILDSETTNLMIALHQLMAVGQSAAVALAQVQRQATTEGGQVAAVAAGFVCVGADHTLTSVA